MKKQLMVATFAWAAVAGGAAQAAEGTVVWYDPTCRYFVMQLPEGSEGFGLYQWQSGPEPQEGDVISGDVLGGPELTLTRTASGEAVTVVHWGDAKKQDTLVRHSPDWCKSKRKRR